MFSFIISRGRAWQIIYFHSLVGSFDVGTLSALKNTLFQAEERAQNLVRFVAVHLGWLAAMRNGGWFKSCRKTVPNMVTISHTTVVDYLRTQDHNVQFALKIVGALPKEVTEIYYQERNNLNYNINVAAKQDKPVQQAQAGHFTQAQQDYRYSQRGKTNELLGQHLDQFNTVSIRYNENYDEEIPMIVYMLTYFFEQNPNLLKSEGIFRITGNAQKIAELNIHMSLNDFSIL